MNKLTFSNATDRSSTGFARHAKAFDAAKKTTPAFDGYKLQDAFHYALKAAGGTVTVCGSWFESVFDDSHSVEGGKSPTAYLNAAVKVARAAGYNWKLFCGHPVKERAQLLAEALYIFGKENGCSAYTGPVDEKPESFTAVLIDGADNDGKRAYSWTFMAQDSQSARYMVRTWMVTHKQSEAVRVWRSPDYGVKEVALFELDKTIGSWPELDRLDLTRITPKALPP